MDLWASSDRWAAPLVPASDPTPHHHTPSTFAAIVMWFTVILPYLGITFLAGWTLFTVDDWASLVIFAVAYLIAGFGVTIGYHRLLAHRAFTTYRPIEAMLYIFGSIAMQGPPIRWAATHRRHHQTSDHDGDPHSPHLSGDGVGGMLRGLWHAHTGWLLAKDAPDVDRSVKDLLRDPVVTFVDRFYWLWLLLSVAIPATLGYFMQGGLLGSATYVMWAVLIRISLLHHVTWSVNSICHFFGYQSYQSSDHSRNNPVIAILSLGEGWHNNHHAFPTSARHGLRWWEVDLSYILIRSAELVGLAWNVRRPSASAMAIKARK